MDLSSKSKWYQDLVGFLIEIGSNWISQDYDSTAEQRIGKKSVSRTQRYPDYASHYSSIYTLPKYYQPAPYSAESGVDFPGGLGPLKC